jgi:hypothetical protein
MSSFVDDESDDPFEEGPPVKAYYDSQEFDFLWELETLDSLAAIRGELQAMLDAEHFQPWPEKNLYEESRPDGWNVFGLYKFGKQKVEENCLLCPKTTALVESIPGMQMAGFSVRCVPHSRTHTHPHAQREKLPSVGRSVGCMGCALPPSPSNLRLSWVQQGSS